jgi:hypothetical protein
MTWIELKVIIWKYYHFFYYIWNYKWGYKIWEMSLLLRFSAKTFIRGVHCLVVGNGDGMVKSHTEKIWLSLHIIILKYKQIALRKIQYDFNYKADILFMELLCLKKSIFNKWFKVLRHLNSDANEVKDKKMMIQNSNCINKKGKVL